jgi:hypothetical protein
MDCPELARGKYEVLATDESAVPSHRCDDGGTVVAVHNFGAQAVEFRLPVKDAEVPSDLIEDGTTKVAKDGTAKVSLEPHGFRWFRVVA